MSKPTNQKFVLKSLTDLLELDQPQLKRWFKDFLLIHSTAQMLLTVANSTQDKAKVQGIFKKIEWTDDGIRRGNLTLLEPKE